MPLPLEPRRHHSETLREDVSVPLYPDNSKALEGLEVGSQLEYVKEHTTQPTLPQSVVAHAQMRLYSSYPTRYDSFHTVATPITCSPHPTSCYPCGEFDLPTRPRSPPPQLYPQSVATPSNSPQTTCNVRLTSIDFILNPLSDEESSCSALSPLFRFPSPVSSPRTIPHTPSTTNTSDLIACSQQTTTQPALPPPTVPMQNPTLPSGRCRGANRQSRSSRRHVCPELNCKKTFARSEHLRRHRYTHTKEKPYSCSVEGCNKRFARRDNLKQHMSVHKRNERPQAVVESAPQFPSQPLRLAPALQPVHYRAMTSQLGNGSHPQ
ncbi:hypothetical protein IWQ62_001045 [Dispira parvispora]|uniref:C2H2-type domain-containing protein n=1 Tax=Dispira parvispora TaxID=1520584 RepID=A0A9W8AVX3_9FUNG|nr:hypothetical protein IWQ62_001045 [Dispira parvispora]